MDRETWKLKQLFRCIRHKSNLSFTQLISDAETNRQCRTVRGNVVNKTCIFPFYHKNKEYNLCTSDDIPKTEKDKTPWCSTEVDTNGVHIKGKYGLCESKQECLGTPKTIHAPGKDFRFSYCLPYSRDRKDTNPYNISTM